MALADDGRLEVSQFAYDKRVAGVISGAGSYKPGIVLDRQEQRLDRKPIALAGKAYCKADAQYGAIETGDLLTTSPNAGPRHEGGRPGQGVRGRHRQSVAAIEGRARPDPYPHRLAIEGIVVVVQTLEVEPIRGLEVALDHAASTAFQISGAVLYLTRSLSSLN
jgi:hypothetical protein